MTATAMPSCAVHVSCHQRHQIPLATWMECVSALAANSSLTVLQMKPAREQFWDSILGCMKMPAGGVNGGGSFRCAFEFVCANEDVVRFLMEDLPCRHGKRYNGTIPSAKWTPPCPWEDSPSISTYCAEDLRTLDSYARLHRRHRAARGNRGAYRGSVLLKPPDDHPAPVAMLSMLPPFLAEYCQRKHGKLVLACSFNVSSSTSRTCRRCPPPAIFKYEVGMDVIFKQRAKNHLKKLFLKNFNMSLAFAELAEAHLSTAPLSEGEWELPQSDLSALGLPLPTVHDLDSGDDADMEAAEAARQAATKHPRGTGTRWTGKLQM